MKLSNLNTGLDMKQEKTIDTPQLVITGNIMVWKDSMLQLSNISSVSAVALQPVPFPTWTLLVFVLGLFALTIETTVALVMVIVAVFFIFVWAKSNNDISKQKKLIIRMNSGTVCSFLFNDKEFLDRVFGVLGAIISEAGKEERNIKIDINNSTISGNAKILNDMNVS